MPSIVINYYARTDPGAFWMHQFKNGVWVILPFAYSHGMPARIRHLVPLSFVSALLGTATLAFVARPFLFLFLFILVGYGLVNLAASAHVALREHNWKCFLLMPWIFASLHILYGLGSLWGILRLVRTPEFWGKLANAKSPTQENRAV